MQFADGLRLVSKQIEDAPPHRVRNSAKHIGSVIGPGHKMDFRENPKYVKQ